MLRKTATLASVCALLTGFTVAGTASAAAPSGESRAATFAAQAHKEGLTDADAAALQRRVDGYLTTMGGKQVAANKIDLGGGSSVVLTLPGEKRARELTGTKRILDSCDSKTFCAFQNSQWWGDQIQMYRCDDYIIPWTTIGSWINNQSTGTVAQFKDNTATVRWVDGGAFAQDDTADWSWVLFVNNCR
ncbi:hypothetical protein ABWJ92_36805 [Streptomyces sp. NPDC000609]|uniref:hypothetical protein n=1 Tax=Streptomyces sp. NPDC000609 TaxID=3160957 RepID=UPI00339899D0